METWPDTLRYRGVSAHVLHENAGGTAEGLPFVPMLRDEGLFCCQKHDSHKGTIVCINI